jgi:phosphoribosyl 1,2-cyclic phosphodiesterase
MLRLVSLSSGSCGNAIYIESKDTKVLIDAGTPLNYLGARLRDLLALRLDQIDAVLLTHEHSDHIRSAAAISRRFAVPVWANAATLDALPAVFRGAHVRVFPVDEPFAVGSFEVRAVPQLHDCQAPVGFMLRRAGKQISLATDLGAVTPSVRAALSGADILVIESNHDDEMLKRSRYPAWLKARIAGRLGHLSNVHAGRTLAETASGREQSVLLAHLSRENNSPEIALATVKRILAGRGVDSIRLGIAGRLAPSAVVTV